MFFLSYFENASPILDFTSSVTIKDSVDPFSKVTFNTHADSCNPFKTFSMLFCSRMVYARIYPLDVSLSNMESSVSSMSSSFGNEKLAASI